MRLTILGSAGSYPAPARACSSYLVESDGFRLLVDCGSGSLANLQTLHPVDAIDAVIVSHRHIDHLADLVGLYHLLRFRPGGPGHVTVYTSADVVDLMQVLVPDDPMLFQVCSFITVAAGNRKRIGPFSAGFYHANHPVPTVALRLEADGTILAYSADSGRSDELVHCARDADLFLCEATWLRPQPSMPADLHLSAPEAAAIADRAGARRLVLTHVAHPTQPQQAVLEACPVFPGPVSAAEDMAGYDIC